MNQQAPERADRREDGSVLVHSIFDTIQGEGPFVGMPCVFVRLNGCNLQCPLCDTEYTSRALRMQPEHVIAEVFAVCRRELRTDQTNIPLVVITGGEPFRQNLEPLVRKLLATGFAVQIETNGTLYQWLPYHLTELMIVCSPKTGTVNMGLLPHIRALKYVATEHSIDPGDGLPIHALEHPNSGKLFRPPPGWQGEVYLQPVDEGDEYLNAKNLRAVVQSCQRHGHRLCLQVHKLIGVE